MSSPTARINGARLWQSLDDLAQIGATARGGVCRLAFTDADRRARAFFASQCHDIGMTVQRDDFGNLFALMGTGGPPRPRSSIMVGSHIDSQATGGKYDGAFGVMCALEIARTLADRAIELRHPFEIGLWANEEGARFSPPMMGSGVFVGRFELDAMRRCVDADGVSLGSEIDADAGLLPLPTRPDRPIAAYIEPHIEQGPVLEQRECSLGVVTGAQAVTWLDVSVAGVSAHAGPTPVLLRSDALLAASEIALAAEALALEESPEARATSGNLQIDRPARNVVPGTARLWLDLRHPDEQILDAMIEKLRERADRIARQRGVSVTIDKLWHMEATRFDPELVTALHGAAKANGIDAPGMISGAGHDALHLAGVCPTAMLFTPCEGGISHNESENMQQAHAAIACQVVFDALLPLLTSGSRVAA